MTPPKRLWALTLAALCAARAGAGTPDFYAHWGDGKAEISSYRIVQSRYGEQRDAHGVLIFVTEDLNRGTLIKVESSTPDEDRIYTLKLNNVLKFKTGIYDYSVMTSVFSAVAGDGGEAFQLKKLNLSSQEWCGHVFEEVRFDGDELQGDLNSYFEREGKTRYELDLPDGSFESEDHLLIRIRELAGSFMEPGERRQITLLPSLWHFRTSHRTRGLEPATLTKGPIEEVEHAGATSPAIHWTWELESGRAKSVWVEEAYPHRILAWKDSEGTSGQLVKTIRVPYWRLHDVEHEFHRDELSLP